MAPATLTNPDFHFLSYLINKVLEQFPYLSLKYSENYGDKFVFNSSVPCPICKKDHKSENIKNDIEGQWGDGEYFGEQTYRLKCWEALYQGSIPVVSVKQKSIHDQAYFCNKVLKLYPDIHLHSNVGAEDIYRCKSESSLCPSCETNHKENIVGRYRNGPGASGASYHIGCMYRYTGDLEVVA